MQLNIKGRFKIKNNLNINYFDVIDTEEKAYWLGFIWSDGYICIRDRHNNGKLDYEFKLSLSIVDKSHLEKFKKALNSDYEIKEYNYNKSNFKEGKEARLMIYNKHFCSNLVDNYNLKPRRKDIEPILNRLPKNLYKHFIRGVFDADGSMTFYFINNGETKKSTVSFSCNEQLCIFINDVFIKEGLANTKVKLRKRHPDKDEGCEQLGFSGNIQVINILDWLYKDSTIYLDRKYEKYIKKWN